MCTSYTLRWRRRRGIIVYALRLCMKNYRLPCPLPFILSLCYSQIPRAVCAAREFRMTMRRTGMNLKIITTRPVANTHVQYTVVATVVASTYTVVTSRTAHSQHDDFFVNPTLLPSRPKSKFSRLFESVVSMNAMACADAVSAMVSLRFGEEPTATQMRRVHCRCRQCAPRL